MMWGVIFASVCLAGYTMRLQSYSSEEIKHLRITNISQSLAFSLHCQRSFAFWKKTVNKATRVECVLFLPTIVELKCELYHLTFHIGSWKPSSHGNPSSLGNIPAGTGGEELAIFMFNNASLVLSAFSCLCLPSFCHYCTLLLPPAFARCILTLLCSLSCWKTIKPGVFFVYQSYLSSCVLREVLNQLCACCCCQLTLWYSSLCCCCCGS